MNVSGLFALRHSSVIEVHQRRGTEARHEAARAGGSHCKNVGARNHESVVWKEVKITSAFEVGCGAPGAWRYVLSHSGSGCKRTCNPPHVPSLCFVFALLSRFSEGARDSCFDPHR